MSKSKKKDKRIKKIRRDKAKEFEKLEKEYEKIRSEINEKKSIQRRN